jgi:hypothetical protein
VASQPATNASTVTSAPSLSPLVSPAGQAVTVQQAERLQAPQQDVEVAKNAALVEQRPDPAANTDVDALRHAIHLSNANSDGRDDNRRDWNAPTVVHDVHDNHGWDRRVRQWDSNWVQYDDYYRPVLCNPYHNTVKIIYVYDNYPRIVYIPPLARIVLDVIRYAAYSFTALVVDAVDTAIDVAVGSFFGGGYYPGSYLAPPPPPPPLLAYNDVPVVVNYPGATYQPFLARRIVDVGDDAVYGEHKVLLDGATPVWGAWTQTADGQRQFEVHKTQQFPGLDDPREGPLPGGYQLRLASDSTPGITAKDVWIIAVDAVVATLALVALIAFGLSRRRARMHH